MNCKPGDLAVIAWSRVPGNTGAIVRVMEVSPRGPHPEFGHQWSCECLYPLRSSAGVLPAGFCGAMPDKFLRPIRDNDGEDETLTWAGKPQGVEV